MTTTTIKASSAALLIAAALVCGVMLSGCGNSTGDIIKLVTECDSLRRQSMEQQQRLTTINDLIVTLNSAMDSVCQEENLIFVNSASSEMPISRTDAINNLNRYEAVLRYQREKINRLERQLANPEKAADNSELSSLVAHMKTQLAEKDAQIADLRAELSRKDVDINKLRRQVASQREQIDNQTATIAELDRRSQAQTKALTHQDELLNKCYVLIGSKKDLERKGVIKKKRLVADAALDKSKFAQVDIRKWREISFQAKRPRILTDMPSSAYVLTTTGDGNFTLQVTKPSAFWSVSSFLVIQTD